MIANAGRVWSAEAVTRHARRNFGAIVHVHRSILFHSRSFLPFAHCTPNCDFGGCCQCLSRQRFPLLLSFSRRNFDVRDMLHHSSSTQNAGPASASARPSPTCATDSELKLHCPGSRAFRFQQPVPACSSLFPPVNN